MAVLTERSLLDDVATSVRELLVAGQAEPASLAPGTSDREREENKEREAIKGRLRTFAERLERDLDWPGTTLLDRIGCELRSHEDLNDLPIERLRDCERFFELACRAGDLVETRPNRRTAVVAMADLIRQTGQDASGLAELLEMGEPTPWDYIALGEISQAARVARINGRVYRPEDRDDDGPFDDLARVHISTPRLDDYVLGERELLGELVSKRIDEHLDDCAACRDAAAYRRKQLRVS